MAIPAGRFCTAEALQRDLQPGKQNGHAIVDGRGRWRARQPLLGMPQHRGRTELSAGSSTRRRQPRSSAPDSGLRGNRTCAAARRAAPAPMFLGQAGQLARGQRLQALLGALEAPETGAPERRGHQGAGLGCPVWMSSMPASSSSLSLRSRLARLLSSCSRLVAPRMLLVTNGWRVT
ncbi:hypothetical protein D3C78_1057330 [compost metagenome]